MHAYKGYFLFQPKKNMNAYKSDFFFSRKRCMNIKVTSFLTKKKLCPEVIGILACAVNSPVRYFGVFPLICG